MKKLNNSGFATLFIVAILLIATIGGAAVLVMNNKNTNDKIVETTVVPKKKKYLEIKELGVKIMLSGDIADANYSMLKTVGGRSSAGISTKSLTTADLACSAENGNFGIVSYFTDPNDSDIFSGNSTMGKVFPDAVKVGEKYVYIATNHQQSCFGANYEKNKELDKKVRDAFDSAKLSAL